jgi:hypothetical protein
MINPEIVPYLETMVTATTALAGLSGVLITQRSKASNIKIKATQINWILFMRLFPWQIRWRYLPFKIGPWHIRWTILSFNIGPWKFVKWNKFVLGLSILLGLFISVMVLSALKDPEHSTVSTLCIWLIFSIQLGLFFISLLPYMSD